MDEYVLSRAAPEDNGAMYRLMLDVYESLENREVFAVGGMSKREFVDDILGQGFGIIARDGAGELAAMLVVHLPGDSDDNLGRDIGLTGAALDGVAHMDIACVAPAHRGHRLEQRLFLYAEAQLPAERWPYLMCTISPDNAPSLHSAERCGYRVVYTGLKYDGHLRHTLLKQRKISAL